MSDEIVKPDHTASPSGRDHLANQHAWDALAGQGHPLTRPAKAEDLVDALRKLDPLGWLGPSIRGRRVLCLAAGGGKHSVQYAAAGAEVTVLDLSPAMLELDRQAAARFRQPIRIVQGDMLDLSMFEAACFDLVIQPVSTCYVPDVEAVYRQVARVTVAGGLYISQHKQPGSLQTTLDPSPLGYELATPCDHPGPLPPVRDGGYIREPGAREYLHRWEALAGGLGRNGFVVEDLVEPRHGDPKAPIGSFGHRSRYVPPYVRIKARRIGEAKGGVIAP